MRRLNVESGLYTLAAAAGLLAPLTSVADSDVWKTAVSGSWSAGLNWVDGSTPSSIFDQATFNLPGAYTVSFSADPDPIGKVTVTSSANVTFASSSRPGNPIVPRTLRLSNGGAGDLDVVSTLTLGSTSGGFPFHLTADDEVNLFGTLNVKFGSDVNAAKVRTTGELNIMGAGSSVTAANYSTFKGDVNVSLGGLLQSGGGIHAGDATVTGAGSRWTDTGTLFLGYLDTLGPIPGVVTVTDGGLFESKNTFLGDESVPGTVTVTGDGSLWANSNGLDIGTFGVGMTNVQPGGTVSSGATVVGPQGRLRLQGGTFDTGEFRVQSGGQFEWTSGTFHVGTHHGDLSFAVGTLAPGHSAGSIAVLGDYTQQSAGILEMEIGGAAQGTQYDVLNVTGNAQLGGQLELKLTSGFAPTPSQTFVIVSANAVAGAFNNVANGGRLAASAGGGSFLVHYGPGSAFAPSLVVLSAFQAGLSGDFDVDGDVDGRDFLVWQRGGSPNPLSTGDLALWQTNFGRQSVSVGAAVPEPNAAWLAAAVVLFGPSLRAPMWRPSRA